MGGSATWQPGDIKTYFITIPAHKFLCIKNYNSIGYWDFWQQQNQIAGQDYNTVCGLLRKIRGKIDTWGSEEENSGQIMAYINDPAGRICSWGIPLAECYGVRLPADYAEEVPPPLVLTDIAEGEYIVFEHGPFDLETQNSTVEQKIEQAMRAFDFAKTGYQLDFSAGRVFYFYHDYRRFWKYIRPVRRNSKNEL